MKKNILSRYNLIFIILLILVFLFKIYFLSRNLTKNNGRELEFTFLLPKIERNCRYKTKEGFDFKLNGCEELTIGEEYTIVGTLKSLSDNKVAYQNNIDIKGIYVNTSKKSLGNLILSAIYKLFAACSSQIQRVVLPSLNWLFDGRNAQIATALTLGTKVFDLNLDLKEQIAKVGLSHMMAVSGFHLNIVNLVFSTILLAIFPRKMVRWLLPFLLSMYAFVVSTPLSVLRALFMLLFALVGRHFFYKQSNSCYLLFMTFILMTFEVVLNVFDVGLQLSFLATLGILLFVNQFTDLIDAGLLVSLQTGSLQETKKIRNKTKKIFDSIKGLILVSFAAQLATLPITVNVFGKYAIFGVLSTIVFSSFLTIAVILFILVELGTLIFGLKSLIFQWFLLPLTVFFDQFLDWFFVFFDWYCTKFGFEVVFVKKWSMIGIIIYYFILFLIWQIVNQLTKRRNVYIN